MALLARIRTVWSDIPGGPAYNNLFFPEPDITQGLIDDVRDLWTDLTTKFPSTCTITVEGDVPIINDATGVLTNVLSGTTRTLTGSGTGEPLPWATQGLVALHTGAYVAGRELQGRVFLPAQSEGQQSTGVPSSSWISDVQTAFNSLLTSQDLRVYSPTHHTSAPVSGAVARNKWAVLRSRRP